jgi:hypothetical protein
MEGFAGVTVIEDNTAAVTVKLVEPVTEPEAAWMVVLPTPTPLAEPELLTTAIPGFEELQVALSVKFRVVPSL